MIKGCKDNEDAIVTLDNPCSTWGHTSDDNQLLELEVCKLLLVCHSMARVILKKGRSKTTTAKMFIRGLVRLESLRKGRA